MRVQALCSLLSGCQHVQWTPWERQAMVELGSLRSALCFVSSWVTLHRLLTSLKLICKVAIMLTALDGYWEEKRDVVCRV